MDESLESIQEDSVAPSHLSESSLDDTSGDGTDHAHNDSTHIDTSCDDSFHTGRAHNDSTHIDTSYYSTHKGHTHNDSTHIDTSCDDSTHIDTSCDDSTQTDHAHNDSTHIDVSSDSVDEVNSGDHTPVDHTHLDESILSSDSEEHNAARSPALLAPIPSKLSVEGDIPCLATPTTSHTPSHYREIHTINSDSEEESDGSHDNDVTSLISSHTHLKPDSPIVVDTPPCLAPPTTSHTPSQYREVRTFNSEEREESDGSHDDDMPSADDHTHIDSNTTSKEDVDVTLPPTGPAQLSPVRVADHVTTSVLPFFQPAHQFRKLVKQLADRQVLITAYRYRNSGNFCNQYILCKTIFSSILYFIP